MIHHPFLFTIVVRVVVLAPFIISSRLVMRLRGVRFWYACFKAQRPWASILDMVSLLLLCMSRQVPYPMALQEESDILTTAATTLPDKVCYYSLMMVGA